MNLIRIDNISQAVKSDELREYLNNNGYEKLVDLEERNFNIAKNYCHQKKPASFHAYFEIDQDHLEFKESFFSA